MHIDRDVILTSIRFMQDAYPHLPFIKPANIINGTYNIKIPEIEKWKAELILRNGGWGKIFDEYYEKMKAEKEFN